MTGLSRDDQDSLVTEHLNLVGHIVAELAARLPRHVDRAELWNAGALGLVEASRRFNPDAGIPFARYAAIRIRGAILDSTRSRDWAGRSVRRRQREVEQAAAALEAALGRAPTDAELAEHLGLAVEELATRRSRAAIGTVLHLDQPDPDDGEQALADRVEEDDPHLLPEEALERREIAGTLQQALQHLPPVQAEVLQRFYLREEMLRDIARDLGLTEARVSQIRSEAVAAMRAFFATLYEGVEPVPASVPGSRARAAFLDKMADAPWRERL